MKLFNKEKKEKVVPVDENGNPIEKEKKEINVKEVVKKVAIALGAAAIGVATFVAVGAAMAVCANSDEITDDTGDGDAAFTQTEDTGVVTETSGTSSKE